MIFFNINTRRTVVRETFLRAMVGWVARINYPPHCQAARRPRTLNGTECVGAEGSENTSGPREGFVLGMPPGSRRTHPGSARWPYDADDRAKTSRHPHRGVCAAGPSSRSASSDSANDVTYCCFGFGQSDGRVSHQS